MHRRIDNTRNHQNGIDLSFALVIEEAASLRNSVMSRMREHGWLVHGTNCAEEALRLLDHIPYNLIVLDSELPGMSGIDFVHALQDSRERREIRVVVVTSSRSPSLQSQLEEVGAFLTSKSSWEIDLFEFLAAAR
jgi:DNA-binding response OmpR family regulator